MYPSIRLSNGGCQMDLPHRSDVNSSVSAGTFRTSVASGWWGEVVTRLAPSCLSSGNGASQEPSCALLGSQGGVTVLANWSRTKVLPPARQRAARERMGAGRFRRRLGGCLQESPREAREAPTVTRAAAGGRTRRISGCRVWGSPSPLVLGPQ